MYAVSKDRNYSSYLPLPTGTCRKVLWKRTNIEGGDGHATGKGNRSLRYELSDEGSGEVLAVYDENQEGKQDFPQRGTLVMNEWLEMGESEEGMWILMGALGICEKARRRAHSSGRMSGGGLGGPMRRV